MPKSRSVEKDVQGFCGWDFLMELVETAPTPLMAAIISAQVSTGGRISEVLELRKWNIDTTLHDEVVVIKNMPLKKRFEKVGEIQKWKCVEHRKSR